MKVRAEMLFSHYSHGLTKCQGLLHLLGEAIQLVTEMVLWENFIKAVHVKALSFPTLTLPLCCLRDSAGRSGTYHTKYGFHGASSGQPNPLQKLSS